MRAKYLDKVETLAVLLLGGVKESALLELPHVRRKDIESAKHILKQADSASATELQEYTQSLKTQNQSNRHNEATAK